MQKNIKIEKEILGELLEIFKSSNEADEFINAFFYLSHDATTIMNLKEKKEIGDKVTLVLILGLVYRLVEFLQKYDDLIQKIIPLLTKNNLK